VTLRRCGGQPSQGLAVRMLLEQMLRNPAPRETFPAQMTLLLAATLLRGRLFAMRVRVPQECGRRSKLGAAFEAFVRTAIEHSCFC
jgi:hypothetical protein